MPACLPDWWALVVWCSGAQVGHAGSACAARQRWLAGGRGVPGALSPARRVEASAERCSPRRCRCCLIAASRFDVQVVFCNAGYVLTGFFVDV